MCQQVGQAGKLATIKSHAGYKRKGDTMRTYDDIGMYEDDILNGDDPDYDENLEYILDDIDLVNIREQLLDGMLASQPCRHPRK